MKNNKIRILVSLFLIAVMIFTFCSCKAKVEGESTTTAENTTAAVNATVTQTEELTQSTEPVDSTKQSDITEVAQPTESGGVDQTETQAGDITEVVSLTEVVEVTDSSGIGIENDGTKTVFYPADFKTSQKKFPVIAWANGTGCNTEFYYGILKEMAKNGYIVIADKDVMAGDGKSLMNSIDYIMNKNGDSSSVFYNKVNTSAIGVCGHSQGGRGCINAAQSDSRIRCLVSLAGASNENEAGGIKIPCLFLTGTSDLVVLSSRWCLPSYNAVSGRAVYASLKGGSHTTCMTDHAKLSGYTIGWFDAYLKNDSNAKKMFEDGGKLSTDSLWQDYKEKN